MIDTLQGKPDISRHVSDEIAERMRRLPRSQEADASPWDDSTPYLLVADGLLSDTDWRDVLDFATFARRQVNVVAVSPLTGLRHVVEIKISSL